MISFIVPAYNARKTIKKCLESLINQSNTKLDYEIIVVDDGSTDETSEFIKEKFSDALLKAKIRLYNKENDGIASARNYGASKASGDYYIYVDSDDFVESSLLHDIEQYLTNGVELIKWKANITYKEAGDYIDKDQEICPTFDVCSGEEGFNKLFGKADLIVPVWDYAIKKNLFIEFPSGRYHEDFCIMPRIIFNAKSMVSINKFEYHYVQTEKSIMRNNLENEKKKVDDILEAFDELIKKTDEYHTISGKPNDAKLSDIMNEKFDHESKKLTLGKKTKENAKIFYTYSLLESFKKVSDDNKEYFLDEIKKRKIGKYIKVRGPKSLIKKILISIKY